MLMSPGRILTCVLLALNLASCCSMFCCRCDPIELSLEYDSLGGARAVTSEVSPGSPSSNDPKTLSIQKSFAEIGVIVDVDPSASKNGVPYNPDPGCVSLASLDQWVGCTKEGKASNGWYAHGLSIPWSTQWPTSSGQIICSSIPGILWQAGGYCSPTPVQEEPVREDFVLFYGNIFPNPANPDKARVIEGVHELSHVLNLHHCDHPDNFYDDGLLFEDGPSVSKCKTHVCAARKALGDGRVDGHVQPGEGNSPFCSMTRKHESLHDRVCCPGDAWPLTSRSGVTLEIAPEFDSYCPNDFPTARAVLAATEHVMYRGPESLDPTRGYLSLWWSDDQIDYTPIVPPVYQDWDIGGNPQFFILDRDEQSFPIWYLSGVPQDHDYWIVARYAGFQDPLEIVESAPALFTVATSPDPVLCEPQAGALANTPEARRALWLLGGDHLRSGLDNWRIISDQYDRSVYAAYANKLLMLHWSQPFYTVAPDGSLSRRDAQLHKAGLYEHRLTLLHRNRLPGYYKNLKLPE